MNQTMQKIETLVRAKVPVIAIQSAEEARVESELQLLAEKMQKRLVTWTAAMGFQEVVPTEKPTERSPDPIASLMRVVEEAKGSTRENPNPVIYLFKDIHQFTKNPVVMRAVRDVAGIVRKAYKVTVILLGANVTINEDAKKDVMFIDFPYPDQGELEEQIDAFTATAEQSGIKVKLNGGRARLIRALQGLTKAEADSVLAQAVITNGLLDERAIKFVMEAKAQIIKESGALEYYAEKASYAEIGGLDLLKAWARQAEDAITPEAKRFGVEAPRGCLLVGVPGCGKSLTAKAIAGSTRPLLRLDVGALFGGLVGQSEQQTRNALKIAEAVAPCVLWIDEIEKGLGSSGGELNGGVNDRVLGTILTWMQEQSGDVFVVATANDVSGIRPELIRRFPVKFFVDLPNTEERAEILKIHLEKRGRDLGAFDQNAIVEATGGFTGSEIEEVVQGALMRAFSRKAKDVETKDIMAVIAQTVPLSHTMAEGIAEMRAWAARARPASSKQESGHKTAEAGIADLLEL